MDLQEREGDILSFIQLWFSIKFQMLLIIKVDPLYKSRGVIGELFLIRMCVAQTAHEREKGIFFSQYEKMTGNCNGFIRRRSERYIISFG